MKKFLLTWAFGATLLAFVAGLVVTGSSASATPAYPPTGQCGLSVASSEIGPGSSVSVSGAGLSANKTYTLSSNGSAVGSAHTNSAGNFSATIRLGSLGSQTLSVAGSRCPRTIVHVVDATHATRQATKAVATTKSSTSTLASTGVRVAGLLTIGFALIGVGVAMLSVRRRSRS
jgi:hypothetical protein